MTVGEARRPLWAAFAGLAVAIVVVDQLSKAWLVSFLAPGQSTQVVGDLVRLVNSHNAGGLFGLLQGQAVPFALLSIVVMGLIVAYHARSGRSPYLTLTLGLLLGGAIGNLIDRVRFGYVIDFVDAGIGTIRFWTFNVADSSISVAILLLLLAAVRPALTGVAPTAAVASVGDDG
jgi:signal peptidase II